ncbi:MAG TPA: hypothetical protein VNO30_32525 [Kofleriaceae bacterium]|nr:hypothetical protein [Kofleriaceae bacterium]
MPEISFTTDDGACPAYDFGAEANVLFYIAGIGMRPAMHAIGECLAASGYRVLSTREIHFWHTTGSRRQPGPARWRSAGRWICYPRQ